MKKVTKKKLSVTLAIAVLLALLCIFSIINYYHFQMVLSAKNDFDFNSLQSELNWIDKFGVIIKEFPQMKNTKIWLNLNIDPNQGLENELCHYSDQKHILELFELQLRLGEFNQLQETLKRITSTERSGLAKGLLALYSGKPEDTKKILEEEQNWNGLTKDEKTLRYLILAQALFQVGDLKDASDKVKLAKALEPKNPGILIITYHIAIWNHEWDQAFELSSLIDNMKWKIIDPEYLAEKAISDLNTNKFEEYNRLINQLEQRSNGQNYINYLSGLQKFASGDFINSKNYLESAYSGNLNNNFKNDTKAMLEFIYSRSKAEQDLQRIYQKE